MVTAAREALLAGGVPGSAVHAELFYVGDEPPEPAEVARSTPTPTAAR